MANSLNQTGQLSFKRKDSSIFADKEWPPKPLSILGTVTKPSNQVLVKDPETGTLSGVRYVVAAEPSNLRPIRSWTITVEKWDYKDATQISAQDVLFVRILNIPQSADVQYEDIIKDIVINGAKLTVDNQNSFNVVMAAVLLVAKVDAGRVPDVEKTLRIYNLDQ